MESNTQKLDVARVLLSALLVPIAHWRLILWFAVPLLVINVAILLVEQQFAGDSGGRVLGRLALRMASMAAWLLLAVACHRIFILGAGAVAGRIPIRWTMQETRFLGWVIGIAFIAGFLCLPGVFLLQLAVSAEEPTQAVPLLYLGLIPGIYVGTRLSLVLPATAIGLTPEFSWAWDASKRNGIRLAVAVFLLPITLSLLLAALPEIQSLAYQSVLTLVGIYIVVVEVAALSLSYRELARENPLPVSPAGTP